MTAWLFWSGGAVFGAAAMALLVWALFADRARGRVRCPKCWYDMTGATGGRCPECGHVAKSDRALRRTRRRWKWAAASALPLMIALFLVVQPKVQRDGWGSVTPATVLILALHMNDNKWAMEALERRISAEYDFPVQFFSPVADRMWRWQWRLLGRTCARLVAEEHRPYAERQTYISWIASAAEAGGGTGAERFHGAIIARLSDPDPDMRRAAAISSPVKDDPAGSITRILPLLDDPEPRPRAGAVTALRLITDSSDLAVPHLITALEHEDPQVRTLALGALQSFIQRGGEWPGMADAILRLRNDDNGDLRAYLVATLVVLQPDSAVEIVREAFQSDDEHTRMGALDAAAMHLPARPDFFMSAVTDGMRDESQQMRGYASWHLGYMQDHELETHAEALLELAHSDDPDVAQAARGALRRIGRYVYDDNEE
jgi:HEAT repeat protein